MSEILVVGSLAYDSISTPEGSAPRTLGGSANYFSVAASHFSKINVVGVVGDDYSDQDLNVLKSRGVNTEGLQRQKGATFHWSGKYEGDMNEAVTLKTELNVFADFNPTLPEAYKKASVVFLANIHPVLQSQVLTQVSSPKLVGMDTMNFWIQSAKEDLLKVLKKVDVVLINEGEAKQLTQAKNAISAAPLLTQMGPKVVVIKRGEYGFVLYTQKDGYFILPAFPVEKVVDPTGAGDTFAGGFFGVLSKEAEPLKIENLKKACVLGSLIASFTIQDFGLGRLATVKMSEVEERLAKYKTVVAHQL